MFFGSPALEQGILGSRSTLLAFAISSMLRPACRFFRYPPLSSGNL